MFTNNLKTKKSKCLLSQGLTLSLVFSLTFLSTGLLNSCAKKQKIPQNTAVSNTMGADYILSAKGYLHFADAEIFNDYLHHFSSKSLPKTAQFSSFSQKHLLKDVNEFGTLGRLFSQEGLLAVGEELFKLDFRYLDGRH
jgi:hypothetical protein